MTRHSELLNQILAKVHPDCVSAVCEDAGCSLSLRGLDPSEYALVALDCPHIPLSQTQIRCDFLFFGQIPDSEQFWVSPIELTVGHRKTWIEVRNQLVAGGEYAERLIPEDQDVEFAPIAAGPFKRIKQDRIRRLTIPFRDGTYFPATVRCESEFLAALRLASGD